MPDKHSPPKNLSPTARAWFQSVMDGWEVNPNDLLLLTMAAETLDEIDKMNDRIKSDGALVKDRWGALRPHPGLMVVRQNRVAFAKLLRALHLEAAAPQPVPSNGRMKYDRPAR